MAEDASLAAQEQRKLAAGYMEISDVAGGFSCGRCVWFQVSCTNPEIRALVSPSHGCCDAFHPVKALVLFPPQK